MSRRPISYSPRDGQHAPRPVWSVPFLDVTLRATPHSSRIHLAPQSAPDSTLCGRPAGEHARAWDSEFEFKLCADCAALAQERTGQSDSDDPLGVQAAGRFAAGVIAEMYAGMAEDSPPDARVSTTYRELVSMLAEAFAQGDAHSTRVAVVEKSQRGGRDDG